jgi:putative sugar O-methyltransferase
MLGLTRARVYRWFGWNKLSAAEQQLLEQMRGDNAGAGAAFRASEYWMSLNRQFDDWFRTSGIADVECQDYNVFFSGKPSTRRCFEYAMWMLYERVKQRDCRGLLDSIPASATSENVHALTFEGRLVSWDHLISIDTLYSLAELYPNIWADRLVVMDLGAGYGRLGYVLKTACPQLIYIDCDLPEALLVASSYLSRLLPAEHIIGYGEVRQKNRITREHLLQEGGVWFCGGHHLPRFDDKSVDVFVNIASFQEMTANQVTTYLGHVNRIVRSACFFQEFWSAGRHRYRDTVISGFEEYRFPSRWKQEFLRNACFSERFFEVGFTMSHVSQGADSEEDMISEKRTGRRSLVRP